ncbi:uncharacterized protein LOC113168923 [Anabas testudineus]|uniref:uncharacterized protein LOC113168923 n=1 Tax=Anabas testudineus TaxID=64144 RepID=UPI000E46504A|nr:uncharacterized protein LOC113168923 [Anabas testudineus]
MPSIIMERGRKNLQNIPEDDLGSELINAGRFCFSCEQIFANRECLEDHICSSASYICSCGTEFTEYKDMQEHSTTHEPGHQVLDHETIKKRRIEKRIEEARQLKRLQTGEVVWKTPKLNNISESVSLPMKPTLQAPITSSYMPQVPKQSAKISQVPQLYPSVSQASLLPNLETSGTDIKNIFGDVGAPTVDLWTLYQPVVLLQTMCKFNKKKAYSCGKCGQCFLTRTSVISHFNSHVIDKVSGCIGCGLLLSSKKVVPRFHFCNSPNNATKLRLITARPLGYRKPNEASSERSENQGAQGPQATSFPQLKRQNPNTVRKSSQTPSITSTLKLKNENIRTYNKSSHRLHVTPSLKLNSPNHSASIKNSRGLLVTPSGPLKTPTNFVFSKSTNASPGPNGFTCRVCHVPFETAHLLQRHKCAKAQEFMAQHVQGGRYKLKRVTPVSSPIPAQINGERKLGMPAAGNIKKHQVVAVTLDEGVDMDDDCYIVESGPDKPAEMIYQVTSSVPIKT